MQSAFDKRLYPAYAWWLAALVVPLLCFFIAMKANDRSSTVLHRSHLTSTHTSTDTKQTDHVARANDQILAREYRRWGSIAGSMIQPLSFVCCLIGAHLAARPNRKRLPWTLWLIVVFQVAFTSSRITGTFAADRISDQIDLMQAKVWSGAASRSEIEPLQSALSGVHASTSEIQNVYLYAMLILLPVVLVQAVIYRWPERPLPSEAPLTN